MITVKKAKQSYLHLITVALLLVANACKEEKAQKRTIIDSLYWAEISRFTHDRYAIRMWADNHFIYFSDTPQNTISVYNYTGKLLRRLGKNGPAPWENGTIWHFSPDETPRHYWVHDYPKQLIKKLDEQTGSLVKSMKVITIDNIQYIGNSRFIVPGMDEKTGAFNLAVYDIDKQIQLKRIDISNLIGISKPSISDRLDFVLNGNMCVSSDKKYSVHYCYNAGYFFKINNKTLDVSLIKDVRNYELPKAIMQYGAVRLKPRLIMVSSAAIDSASLYVLTSLNGNFSKTDKFYIDRYNLKKDMYEKR